MAAMTLYQKDTIDPEIEGFYANINAQRAKVPSHNHDFFEFFVVTGGRANHHVNRQIQTLEIGTMVFVRPTDIHRLEDLDCGTFQFVNLAFSAQSAADCIRYLEGTIPFQDLLSSPLPPLVALHNQSLLDLTRRMERWNSIPLLDKRAKRAKLRALIVELFTYYYPIISTEYPNALPQWLSVVLVEMDRKEYLEEGLPAMIRISQRSQEHLCRVVKKFTGLSPTAYISIRRLEYAANLLVNSNHSVFDIMMDTGFKNLSHFNQRFKSHFGCTPSQLRKRGPRTGFH